MLGSGYMREAWRGHGPRLLPVTGPRCWVWREEGRAMHYKSIWVRDITQHITGGIVRPVDQDDGRDAMEGRECVLEVGSGVAAVRYRVGHCIEMA